MFPNLNKGFGGLLLLRRSILLANRVSIMIILMFRPNQYLICKFYKKNYICLYVLLIFTFLLVKIYVLLSFKWSLYTNIYKDDNNSATTDNDDDVYIIELNTLEKKEAD